MLFYSTWYFGLKTPPYLENSTSVKNALGLKKSSTEKYEHLEHLKIILNILKYVTPTIYKLGRKKYFHRKRFSILHTFVTRPCTNFVKKMTLESDNLFSTSHSARHLNPTFLYGGFSNWSKSFVEIWHNFVEN